MVLTVFTDSEDATSCKLSSSKANTRPFCAAQYPCEAPGCNRWFRNLSGLTQHKHTLHPFFNHHDRASLLREHTFNSHQEGSHQGEDGYQGEHGSHEGGDPFEGEHEALRAEFVGPGSKLYRNYHLGLNGKPVDP